MLYYQPAIPNAYHNMKDLQYVVSDGMFLRNMHRWAAHLMVITVFLHMLRVFYKGAYQRPTGVQLGYRSFPFPVNTAA